MCFSGGILECQSENLAGPVTLRSMLADGGRSGVLKLISMIATRNYINTPTILIAKASPKARKVFSFSPSAFLTELSAIDRITCIDDTYLRDQRAVLHPFKVDPSIDSGKPTQRKFLRCSGRELSGSGALFLGGTGKSVGDAQGSHGSQTLLFCGGSGAPRNLQGGLGILSRSLGFWQLYTLLSNLAMSYPWYGKEHHRPDLS